MEPQTLSPQTREERIVWHTLRATYLFFALGALYLVAPVLGWTLLLMLLLRLWRGELSLAAIPTALWVWLAGMGVMLIALVVGHLNFELGLGKIIKSSIGWAKGWALLAIFPLLGFLKIRPEIIYRASAHVCLHTLLLLPLFIGAWKLGLPQTLYVSPLKAVGGPGPEFFAVSLYEIDPGSGLPRWRLFTPWAPALGFLANIFFIFALQERDRRWRWIAICGSLAMVIMSASRLALLSLLLVWLSTWFICRLRSHNSPFLIAAGLAAGGMVAVPLLELFDRLWQGFRSARADSTRVREALGRIALERWQSEAPWWGHGILERGPHLVEFMLIGSHHSWYGLLFVKGAIGLLGLAIPLFFSLLQLAWWGARLPLARVSLAMVLLLFLYTFGENLEILAYLIWPALLVMGIAHCHIAASIHPQPEGENNHAQNQCHYAGLQRRALRGRRRSLGTQPKLQRFRAADHRRYVPRWQHRHL
ncbi:MAG: O-antigen ligase domain-containing protein [Candidatus Thiodiazotropha sp.]|jgi:hypothetical protein